MKQGNLLRMIRPAIAIMMAVLAACTHEPFADIPVGVDPGIPGCTNNGQVCFESTILPLFISSCARPGCHDAASREEGLVLDSYTNIIREGIKPGDAGDSELYKVLLKQGDDRMPPDASLTPAQIDSIELWINQGAKNTVDCSCYCDTTKFSYALDIGPLLNNACVGCHKPGALSGDVDLSGYAQVKVQADNGNLIGTITHASGYTPMPQGGKLQECEITKVTKWIKAGMPDD